jgi:hypothetical protein
MYNEVQGLERLSSEVGAWFPETVLDVVALTLASQSACSSAFPFSA